MDDKNISSSSKSLLPEDVRAKLEGGMRDAYKHAYFGDGYLDLQFMKINDSMISELCEWLHRLDDKVKLLNLSNNQITSQGASTLLDALRATNSSIKQITLGINDKIDDKCMKSLGECVKSNKQLDDVWLCGTGISDVGIEILVPYFEGNTSFKWLNVAVNKGITDKSIPFFIKMIETSQICNLDIDYTSMTQTHDVKMSLAFNKIKYGSSSMILVSIALVDDDVLKICEAMKKYGIDGLQELYLFDNKITSKGASVLFDTLRECKSIIFKLNISGNQMDDECMKQLGEYLQDNEHLENLDCSSNGITDKGVEILSEYLIGNTILKEFNFNFNKGITDTSVPYLIEMAKNSCIDGIHLWSTGIADDNKKHIEQTLSVPIDKREIPIKSNTKSATKASYAYIEA